MRKDFSDFISEVLTEASAIAVRNFGKVNGATKPNDNNQVLTKTDLEIGRLIIDRICETFPDHNIIDEEAGLIDNSADFTWVVDPVDGTSNFAAGVPTYGIMVGLLAGTTPVAGGISLPSFHEIYVAERGGVTLCNGMPIHVTSEISLSSVLVAYGIDSHREAPELTESEMASLASIVLGIRNLRSSNSCFDCAMVAKGGYGACLNRTSKIWDNVAQQVIIEQAGGVYTDFQGNPMDYSHCLHAPLRNYTWCYAAPPLHAALQLLVA